MRHLRLIGVSLLAALALGAAAASVAQAEEAPFWIVGGTRLGAGQTRFIYIRGASNFVLKGAGVNGLKVECKKALALPLAVILGSGSGEPGKNDETITFDECKVENNGAGTECTKVTEPINTANLTSELVLDKTKTKLLGLLKPASGTVLAELKFPAGCTVAATKVTGDLVGEWTTDTEAETPIEPAKPPEQAVSWNLRFPSVPIVHVWLVKEGRGKEVETGEIEASGSPATLTWIALITLADLNKKGELEPDNEPWLP
jgi:hypothetical protein